MRELNVFHCQVCGLQDLRLVDEFVFLPRITSDCKPFPMGGELSVCMDCGAIQKIPNAKWFAEISDIYASYQAYEIADGEEQLVFDQISGQPRKRSEVLTENLLGLGLFPEMAKILDVGCGDGVTLSAMSSSFPGWHLNGHELTASKEPKLKAIQGFGQLFTGDLEALPFGFDIISMVHSLEHFPAPFETLKILHAKLKEEGYIFIEVCNIEENPFDVLVADHLMHFSPASLSRLLSQAGFIIRHCETDWVKKEISLVAQKVCSVQRDLIEISPAQIVEKITDSVHWLGQLVESVRNASNRSQQFGLFGTAIAASWLAGELDGKVGFFVDEDPNRIGRVHLGKPVLHPKDVEANSVVFLALAPALAEKIAERMKNYPWIALSPTLP